MTNEIQESIDAEEAQERRRLVELLRPYCELRFARDAYDRDLKPIADLLKSWLQLRPEEEIADLERGIVARLQERHGADVYELARMPEDLVLALWRSNALTVNGAVLKALGKGHELSERAKPYARPGPVTTALEVKETR